MCGKLCHRGGYPSDTPLLIHALHYRVVFGFPLKTGGVREAYFQKIGLCVEPDFWFFGQISGDDKGILTKTFYGYYSSLQMEITRSISSNVL